MNVHCSATRRGWRASALHTHTHKKKIARIFYTTLYACGGRTSRFRRDMRNGVRRWVGAATGRTAVEPCRRRVKTTRYRAHSPTVLPRPWWQRSEGAITEQHSGSDDDGSEERLLLPNTCSSRHTSLEASARKPAAVHNCARPRHRHEPQQGPLPAIACRPVKGGAGCVCRRLLHSAHATRSRRGYAPIFTISAHKFPKSLMMYLP